MKPTKRPGRPKKQANRVDKTAILACALTIIEDGGLNDLTFRALAAKLGVTPMAVSYHVGSRDQMIAELIERAFEGVASDVPNGSPSEKLRFLLLRYCEVALTNSSLVRCMLAEPKLMPKSVLLLTDQVRQQTQKLNMGDMDDVMLNLVIDYVHGFVFSTDAAPKHVKLTLEDCARVLDWLIGMTGRRVS